MQRSVLSVDCRIGSLETSTRRTGGGDYVDCRIGSLEIYESMTTSIEAVDCRIGSLENI